jgi:hypothetical protein
MIKQILIAFDQFINACLGGWADETLSARSWRTGSFFRSAIDTLFFFEDNHCRNSYYSEIKRLQSPPEERQDESF